MKKINIKNNGYITLVVVIILTPFLLLQGINLINTSIDIVHISTNSIAKNKQHINEQSCWEEISYHFKNRTEDLGEIELTTPEITCKFQIEELGEERYKIILETEKDSYYSSSERYLQYNQEKIEYIVLQ